MLHLQTLKRPVSLTQYLELILGGIDTANPQLTPGRGCLQYVGENVAKEGAVGHTKITKKWRKGGSQKPVPWEQ